MTVLLLIFWAMLLRFHENDIESILTKDSTGNSVTEILNYLNHHFVEALLMCGKKDQAMEYMKYYWGGMLSHGADTFWELYNPENPAESPYGSSIVNSYCHAWSCTPTYLLRKYFN